MLYLSDAEVNTLRTLEGGRWLTPSQIAKTPPANLLHVQTVRAALKELARRGLVERGSWASNRWGDYRLTEHGADELLVRGGAGQLRLVG